MLPFVPPPAACSALRYARLAGVFQRRTREQTPLPSMRPFAPPPAACSALRYARRAQAEPGDTPLRGWGGAPGRVTARAAGAVPPQGGWHPLR